jgi:hypothetical protein
MADLNITLQNFNDGTGGATSGFPAALRITVTTNGIQKEYFCDVTSVLISLDEAANYLELYANNHCLYKYVAGDTFNTGAMADAATMFDSIRAVLYT